MAAIEHPTNLGVRGAKVCLGPVQSALVCLILDGLEAERRVVSAHYRDGCQQLIDFLAVLAQCFGGWKRIKQYVSLEGDPTLSATYSGNRVIIDVVLSPDIDEWTVNGSISLEPGEEF